MEGRKEARFVRAANYSPRSWFSGRDRLGERGQSESGSVDNGPSALVKRNVRIQTEFPRFFKREFLLALLRAPFRAALATTVTTTLDDNRCPRHRRITSRLDINFLIIYLVAAAGNFTQNIPSRLSS